MKKQTVKRHSYIVTMRSKGREAHLPGLVLSHTPLSPSLLLPWQEKITEQENMFNIKQEAYPGLAVNDSIQVLKAL